MDTLGTISPPAPTGTETNQRLEAMERLNYLAHTGGCGLLTGEGGSGKSWLLSSLASQLRREGVAVAQIDLTGVRAREIPSLIEARLGMGSGSGMEAIELWSLLQDYAEARRRSPQKMAILLDHVDRAAEPLQAPLQRVMQLFDSHCGWILAASSESAAAVRAQWSDRMWLRIELGPLQKVEAARIMSWDLLSRESRLRLTPDALDAAWRLSRGRIRNLRRLAELTSLAAEAEHLDEITGELVLAVAGEIVSV